MVDAIDIEVLYALPQEQELLGVSAAPGITVGEAIRLSGILQKHPEIDLGSNKTGVYGKLCGLDTPLRDRDRVEIYRRLIADPKEVRRRRAAEGKVMKKGAAG